MLRADEHEFVAHKVVLSVFSPVFKNLFFGMPENQHALGKINDAFLV